MSNVIGLALGDRMKLYEKQDSQKLQTFLLPIIARMDGRSFHTFTKGLNRPFDKNLSDCMIKTTEFLVNETGACMGYTQSDEITLAWYNENPDSQIWFDGKVQKMVSQLAAQATLSFYREVVKRLPDYADKLPSFDARVWNVPSKSEGANAFLWRELDAIKNSVSMAANEHFSNKELHGKHSDHKLWMLKSAGIDWNDYPTHFKRGTYVQRRTVLTKFSTEEIDRLPAKHAARSNPDLVVERSVVDIVELPLLQNISNGEEVIFSGDEPLVRINQW